MALASSLVGDGLLVSTSKIRKPYLVTSLYPLTIVYEDTTEEVREWFALTAGAAGTAVSTATQPSGGPDNGSTTWEASEQNRPIGAYNVRATTTIITYASVVVGTTTT
jgi:hypothetical protein